jgi:SagB-type dehydrogenase family enzyme
MEREGVFYLPEPVREGLGGLAEAFFARRSGRSFSGEPLSLAEAGTLLFAAQGVNRVRGFRTAPSAGALYPLEVYLAAGRVEELSAGVYHYEPLGHGLSRITEGDARAALAAAALGQRWMAKASAILGVCAVYERCRVKYGRRSTRYTDFEAGCAGQNAALAAANLGLSMTVVGAFSDEDVASVLNCASGTTPLALMPVGPGKDEQA